ncbi:MAG: glycosyltransferase family 4 protein [Chloroflexi bacterium]|nr:glycosyltransferase family 4 protein [Chloroflexota bacterium]
MSALRAAGASDVCIFQPSSADWKMVFLAARILKWLKVDPEFNSLVDTPPGMRVWFSRQMQAIRPRHVIISYAYWSRLKTLVWHLPATRRVASSVDTHDIVSRQIQLRRRLLAELPEPPIDPGLVKAELLNEHFFTDVPYPAKTKEFAEYDRFDNTIAISQTDLNIIKARTRRTKPVLIGASVAETSTVNEYSAPPVFATGPNPFNTHGYVYFTRRVLPLVLKGDSEFEMDVLGHTCTQVQSVRGVNLRGYVDNLGSVYARARFAVSPVFGGTGQQLKIVEAMAHGLPVVALKAGAEHSPVVHGVNGFLAEDAPAFAEYVLQLSADENLCRRFGCAAREEIRTNWSQVQTTQKLARLLSV